MYCCGRGVYRLNPRLGWMTTSRLLQSIFTAISSTSSNQTSFSSEEKLPTSSRQNTTNLTPEVCRSFSDWSKQLLYTSNAIIDPSWPSFLAQARASTTFSERSMENVSLFDLNSVTAGKASRKSGVPSLRGSGASCGLWLLHTFLSKHERPSLSLSLSAALYAKNSVAGATSHLRWRKWMTFTRRLKGAEVSCQMTVVRAFLSHPSTAKQK